MTMRLRHALLAMGSFGVLGLLASLTPSTYGIGTHRTLGLPPCFFLAATGWPCPSCGLTTSVVHLLHGEWRLGLVANPFGPIALITAIGFGGVNLYGIAKPIAWSRWIVNRWFHGALLCAMAWLLGAWIFRIIHMTILRSSR
ncbi:MAG: DUF2752 domain-containing protein [Deltaproteobacteria bacterium]|nr:DUF2752 domain-containing protein [Deltaproteobacteria bacterium]